MLSIRPSVSRRGHPLRPPLLVAVVVIGAVLWLGLLIATHFNILAVSAGLVAMLWVTNGR